MIPGSYKTLDYNNFNGRDHFSTPSTLSIRKATSSVTITTTSRTSTSPPYRFFPPVYSDSMLKRFSVNKRRITTTASSSSTTTTTTAIPFRNYQPQTPISSMGHNSRSKHVPQYQPVIKFSEPLSYPNPLDTNFRQDDVELFDPSSYQNFAFSKTQKVDGNGKKDLTSSPLPKVGENMPRAALPEDNFIPGSQGKQIQSRFPQKYENQFVSSADADNSFKTKYWSQSSAINNIKSHEKPTKTGVINSLSPESSAIFQSSNNYYDGGLSGQLPRKMSTPVAKSGWTILDEVEDEPGEYDGDYGGYDDYDWSNYEYDYKYAARRSSQEDSRESQFSDLHFNILSSPADIPKIGIRTEFRPIEVIYNEMFKMPQNLLKSVKQARSFDFVAAASERKSNNFITTPKTTSLPFLPTPKPVMVHSRSFDGQNFKQSQSQRIFSKRFLNNSNDVSKIASNSRKTNHQSLRQVLDTDFEIKRTQRKKKSFPNPKFISPPISSESILHAIVQSEMMER